MYNSSMINNFATNIRESRLQKRITQKEMANDLGITQRKISYWEGGRIEPDLDMLLKLADYFEVSIDELLK